MDMHTIVTHGGRAHRDEFLAIALILSGQGSQPRHFRNSEFRIVRRNPAPSELNDPDTWVVDVGGRHEPDRLNFDHHQPEASGSALSQVADYLDIDLSIYQWFDTTVTMDNEGPGAVAQALGIAREQMLPLTDPIGKGVLVQFEECDIIAPSMPGSDFSSHGLYETMERMGKNLVAYAERVSDQVKSITESAFPHVEVGGLHGVDGRVLGAAPEPKTMALVKEKVESALDVEVSFSVSHDSRGAGLALFRYEEGESTLDFSRLEGRDGVLFTHRGGFLATTQSADADWGQLVQASVR